MHYWRVRKENKHSIGNKSSFLSCFRGNYSMYYTRSQDKAILILFMIREKLLSLLFIFNFFFTSFFLSLALHHHIYQVLIKHLISPQIWYLFLFFKSICFWCIWFRSYSILFIILGIIFSSLLCVYDTNNLDEKFPFFLSFFSFIAYKSLEINCEGWCAREFKRKDDFKSKLWKRYIYSWIKSGCSNLWLVFLFPLTFPRQLPLLSLPLSASLPFPPTFSNPHPTSNAIFMYSVSSLLTQIYTIFSTHTLSQKCCCHSFFLSFSFFIMSSLKWKYSKG